MSNQYNNKVVLANGTTLIDLTGDDVTAADVAQGKIFHLPTGEQATGTASGGGGNIGGLANMVDVTNINYEFGYMLSQMKNGNTVGGTVTYLSNFPNTESLLIATGLTEIHGFMFVNPATDITTGTGSSAVNKTFFAFVKQDQTLDYIGSYSNSIARSYNNTNGTAVNATPVNGALRISGGNIYYTGRYNKNANYQLLAANTLYEWLAW